MHKYVKMWAEYYAKPGYPDQRSLQDFVDCETAEVQGFLRNELIGIARGNYVAETLDTMIGKARIARHGSYDAWAALMLQWMATTKRA